MYKREKNEGCIDIKREWELKKKQARNRHLILLSLNEPKRTDMRNLKKKKNMNDDIC